MSVLDLLQYYIYIGLGYWFIGSLISGFVGDFEPFENIKFYVLWPITTALLIGLGARLIVQFFTKDKINEK